MNLFIQKHAQNVIGILSGFDRLVFHGTIRYLTQVVGMMDYLWRKQVLLKDYTNHVKSVTEMIKLETQQLAYQAGRPLIYLDSPSINKEELARSIAKKDQVKMGLICILSSLELCPSFEVYRNKETKHLELRSHWRKCLHYYQYRIDPQFGWMNARLQTWFPFNIQVCLNGREWLARSLDLAGLGYIKKDNCFTRLEDVERTQCLLDEQLRCEWPKLLDEIAGRLNPAHSDIFTDFMANYYWSTYQSEWATDVMFKDATFLSEHYGSFIRHGLTTFGSADVMRFLGRKVPVTGFVHGSLQKEVVSDVKRRQEGVRIKHRLGANSIKVYDKQGSILRVETTINDARDFRVYRPKDGGAADDLSWQRMRKGVADLHRQAEVSGKANERYLDGLSMVEDSEPLVKLASQVCQPASWHGERVRALNPYSPADISLLRAINQGEFAISGFRNRDLRQILVANTSSDKDKHRQSSSITRQLRMLRAHGLIIRVPRTHRYQLTTNGRRIIIALITASNSDVNKLINLAA